MTIVSLSIAIIILLIVVIAYLILRVLSEYFDAASVLQNLSNTDYGLTPESFSRWPLGREVFVQTGRLPMSRIAIGDAFRWHDPECFWSGEEFYRTFENGPWKWSAAQRYAGADLNCGHYFAVTAVGAMAEAQYYGLDLSNMQLLKIHGKAESVLDLTHEDNLLAVSRMAIENPQVISDDTYLVEILSLLTDESKSGGNLLTDYIGYWAQNQGYDGIMFFGARALKSDPEFWFQIRHGNGDRSIFAGKTYDLFEQLRRSYDLINVVYFSGANLVTKIQQYAFPADACYRQNELYGQSASAINSLMTYDQGFQDQRSGRFSPCKIKL